MNDLLEHVDQHGQHECARLTGASLIQLETTITSTTTITTTTTTTTSNNGNNNKNE